LGKSATGIWWEEARDSFKHPAVYRTLPTTKNYPKFKMSKMSAVPMLRNTGLRKPHAWLG